MRAVVLSCLAAAILVVHVAECRVSEHHRKTSSDGSFADLLKRELEKKLEKSKTKHVEKVDSLDEREKKSNDGRKMFLDAIQRGLLASKASVKVDEEDAQYFQPGPTCLDGTVMKLPPFGAILYPGLQVEPTDIDVNVNKECTHVIEAPEGQQVYFIFIVTSSTADGDCDESHGQLNIYDGDSPSEEGLFIHRCTGSLPNIVSSKTNKVFVSFKPGNVDRGGLWIYYIKSGDANFTV